MAEMVPKVYCDNQSAIVVATENVLHRKSKHIELKTMHIREKILNVEINIDYISTGSNIADVLTKGVGRNILDLLSTALFGLKTDVQSNTKCQQIGVGVSRLVT